MVPQSARLLVISLVAAVPVLGFSPISPAGSLQKSRVAGDAQWVAHVDIEAIAASKVLEAVRAQHDGDVDVEVFALELDELEGVKQHLGFDPLKDIKDVTAYGNGNPETDLTFVAIFNTTAAVDDFLESLKAQAPDYKQFEAGGFTVQSFTDEHDQKVFFNVASGPTSNDRTIVVSKDTQSLVRAVTLTQGKGSSLAGVAKSGALANSPAAGSFFFVSAQGLPWLEADEDEPGSAFLRDAESIVVDTGEAAGETYMVATLASKKAEDATNVADMVRGLAAMGKIAVGNQPELAPFKASMNAIKIGAEGNTVTVSFRQRSEALLEALKALDAADHEDEDDDEDDEDQQDAGNAEQPKGAHVSISVETTTRVETAD